MVRSNRLTRLNQQNMSGWLVSFSRQGSIYRFENAQGECEFDACRAFITNLMLFPPVDAGFFEDIKRAF